MTKKYCKKKTLTEHLVLFGLVCFVHHVFFLWDLQLWAEGESEGTWFILAFVLCEQDDIWATVRRHQHTSVRHMSALIPTGVPMEIIRHLVLWSLPCNRHRKRHIHNNHGNSFLVFWASHAAAPSRLQENKTQLFALFLPCKSLLIKCCLLYCEIVVWLFNWAWVCYYGLPNVKYYLWNTKILFLFHYSLGRRETCFQNDWTTFPLLKS